MSEPIKPTSKEKVLKPAIQEQLGQALQEAYSDIIQQPVPDRFLELLNQLERTEQIKKDVGIDGK